MRIAMLTTQFITEASIVGGIGNSSFRTALVLKERGHDVEIFTAADRSDRIECEGLLVHRVHPEGKALGMINRLAFDRLARTLMHLKLSCSVRQALHRRHRERPFDVVHATNLAAAGLATALSRKVPVVTRISSYRWLSYQYHQDMTFDLRLCETLDRFTIRHTTAAYAPSKLVARAASIDLGVPVTVVRPPFFLETRNKDDTVLRRIGVDPYLLFFGTLCFVKGVHILADAAASVLRAHPHLRLVLVGNDAEAPGFRSGSMWQYVLARIAPYRDRVLYLGALSHAQLYAVVARARGVVLPSITDNLPNACLEAMALGRVVIGTRGTSLDELLEDSVSGFLVPPGDASALSVAMANVWHMDESARDKIGVRAKASLAPFAPAVAGAELEDLLSRYAR